MAYGTSGSWRVHLVESSVVTRRILVTPEIARDMLTLNARNRSVRERTVRQFADLMRRGLWTENHPDSISFSQRHELIDGQHRLLAIVSSQQAQPMNVVFGVAEEAKLTIGSNMGKTLGDRLWISGKGVGETPYAHQKSGEVAHRMMHGGSGEKNRATTEDIVDFIQTHRDALAFVAEAFGPSRVGRITTAPVKAVIGRAYYHVPLEQLRRFVEVLMTGEVDLFRQDHNERAILLARNYLLVQRQSVNSNAAGEVYLRVARALKAYVNNEPLQLLKAISYDPYPLPASKSMPVLVEALA